MFLNSYDRSLQSIKDRVNLLGQEVSRMLEQALASLYHQDQELATWVLNHDDSIDDETNQIEEDSLQLISLQQPRQKDLRILAAGLRNVRDLERIADYSCDIAEVTHRLAIQPYFKKLDDLARMGHKALVMVNRAQEAVRLRDQDMARDVFWRDDQVDDLYRALHDEMLQVMRRNPDAIEQASNLSLVARYLERIADHAVNIAEMAVFVETGDRRPFRLLPHHNPEYPKD
ncbi:MAG: phosphate signaling complex protein PhoU [Sulfobacillus thermotolerans]|uniref:Phosphate-specific transport system accessory protein PhoU n=1 Tax=Sulfobacillus thermotolerans TaxID=338644 RepID=A0ABN5GXG5_9FIRM|nr:phosphate transport system regulatory protein PhoU [Sulfobacillus thermotolerans]MCY0907308.1 phosphate signaling complex protein PhoU [Sulfobacillus thermotolerans]